MLLSLVEEQTWQTSHDLADWLGEITSHPKATRCMPLRRGVWRSTRVTVDSIPGSMRGAAEKPMSHGKQNRSPPAGGALPCLLAERLWRSLLLSLCAARRLPATDVRPDYPSTQIGSSAATWP